jgi:hypothetical protein
VLSVGWLEDGNPFPTGDNPEGVFDVLWELARREPPAKLHRGFHYCDLCPASAGVCFVEHLGEKAWVGHSVLAAFQPSHTVYQAPGLIVHYVRDHRYLLPSAFVDALLHTVAMDDATYQARVADYRRHPDESPRR